MAMYFFPTSFWHPKSENLTLFGPFELRHRCFISIYSKLLNYQFFYCMAFMCLFTSRRSCGSFWSSNMTDSVLKWIIDFYSSSATHLNFLDRKTWCCWLGPTEIPGAESKQEKGVKMNQRQNFPRKMHFFNGLALFLWSRPVIEVYRTNNRGRGRENSHGSVEET